jgi:hypothetical protein
VLCLDIAMSKGHGVTISFIDYVLCCTAQSKPVLNSIAVPSKKGVQCLNEFGYGLVSNCGDCYILSLLRHAT